MNPVELLLSLLGIRSLFQRFVRGVGGGVTGSFLRRRIATTFDELSADEVEIVADTFERGLFQGRAITTLVEGGVVNIASYPINPNIATPGVTTGRFIHQVDVFVPVTMPDGSMVEEARQVIVSTSEPKTAAELINIAREQFAEDHEQESPDVIIAMMELDDELEGIVQWGFKTS